jgi:Tol biopolymer transport system component
VSLAAVTVVALVGAFVAVATSRGNETTKAVDADVVAGVARVNVSSEGIEARGVSSSAVLSASGRYVAFLSGAPNLVAGDRNGARDVFVRDLRTHETSRTSVSSGGVAGNGPSEKPSISADGRIVAFPSSASNLVPDDENGVQDVFVRDRGSGTTRRVSAGPGGEANGRSLASLVNADGRVVAYSSDASNLVPDDENGALDVFLADLRSASTTLASAGLVGESADRSEASSIAADGRIVAFRSYAPNLVADDWNGLPDVFVRDVRAQATTRVNVSTAGAESDAVTFRGMLSADGRFVGFRSRAEDLVDGDTNAALDVFVHDLESGVTSRVSVATDGRQADSTGFDRPARASSFMSRPFLSANGRYAAFTSRAPNLVERDRNGKADVFVHDLWTGRTVRVSLTSTGGEANGDSCVAGISANGRVVAFTSLADNLVPGDTNGLRDVFVVRLRRLGAAGAAPGTPR